MTPVSPTEKFASELLTVASRFDQGDMDNPSDDASVRIEVLKHFVEQYLEHRISSEVAEQINELTQHPGECESYDLAPVLSDLLKLA